MFIKLKNNILNSEDITAVETRRELKTDYIVIHLRYDSNGMMIRCENEKERDTLLAQLERQLGVTEE